MTWTARPEAGAALGLRLFRALARRGGRGVARLFLWPVTLYYLLVRGPERAASRAFLARVHGRPARLAEVARHIHTFASTILDRVFMLGGQFDRFEIDVTGLDALHAALDQRRGLLLFGSHLGSFEVLRVLARRRPDVQVRVVLDVAHNRALTQALDAIDPQIARTVIDAGQDGPSIVLAIKQATDAGALVALLVDRARPGEGVRHAPLLGAPAPFPVAPWLIASALGVPVVLAFGLYRGGRRYELAFEAFSDGILIARHERAQALDALVARYAARLQARVASAPYNWFNFYDFWQADAASTPGPDAAGAGRRAVERRAA